jgi:hypothetical protein
MRKHTHARFLLLASALLPLQIVAAGINSRETIAGLAAQVSLSSLPEQRDLDLVVASPSGRETLLHFASSASGKADVTVAGSNLTEAGTYHLTVEDQGTHVQNAGTLAVLPDTVDARGSEVLVGKQTIAPDGRDEADVTVVLKDRFGNLLSGRPVQLISSRREDIVESDSRETDARGEQHFYIRTRLPGQIQIRAMDILTTQLLEEPAVVIAGNGGGTGGRYSYSNNAYDDPYANTRADVIPRAYAQNFDVIDHFEVSIEPPELKVNDVASLRITALDRSGNKVEDYVGTVQITTPEDPNASVPSGENGRGQASFYPKNIGEKFLPLVLMFTRPGRQTVLVEDRTNPQQVIRGEAEVVVRGTAEIPESQRIVITSHKPDGAVSTYSIVLEGHARPYTNLRVIGGAEEVTGDTDESGNFSIPVQLPENQKEFTLNVEGENGERSGSLHLVFDNEEPTIESFTVTPETPETGAPMTVKVVTEVHATVTLQIEGNDVQLEESTKTPGTYLAQFDAPVPGSYQPKVTATDNAGNTVKQQATLVVTPKSLPQVQGLTGESRANAVFLQWKAEPEAEAYRIYVGEKENDFLYTLDTDRAATSATVAGLKPGVLYYFAVTALKGSGTDARESKDKSKTISARPLGVKLDIGSAPSALVLRWTFPESTKISAFQLEYGVDPKKYTEKRLLNGDIRTTTITDLIDGVTYYVQLTPLTDSFDLLSDLAASGQGTPAGGEEFHPSPSDAGSVGAPGGTVGGSAGGVFPPLHSGAPQTPGSGIPSAFFWLTIPLAGVVLYVHWQRRRTLRQTAAFFEAMQRQYRQ